MRVVQHSSETDEQTDGAPDTTITDERTVEAVLGALNDADCRAILDATGTDARTTKELAETCDLPVSTTYRKLEQLTETGLVEERTRVSQSSIHPSEYIRTAETVTVEIDVSDGTKLQITTEP